MSTLLLHIPRTNSGSLNQHDTPFQVDWSNYYHVGPNHDHAFKLYEFVMYILELDEHDFQT